MQDLTERLNAVLALDPSANAIGTLDGQWFSYAALSNAIAALDALLHAHGVGKGAAVAVLLRNRPAHFAVTLAVLVTRRCLVTVNPSLPDAPLAGDIATVRAGVIIASGPDWERDAVCDAARDRNVLTLRIGEQDGAITIDPLDAPATPLPVAARPDIAIEMLTSGTTGKPKRIELLYDSFARSLWAGSQYEAGSANGLGLKRSVGIQWMPLVHIGGLFGAVYAFYNGRAFVLMERFNVDDWHGLILRHRPKFVNLPPSALHMVLERNYPAEDFASLMALRSGAAPLDHDLALEFERRYKVPVLESYGATEFAGGVAGWTIRDHRKFAATKRRSVGRANPGVELRVVDRASFEPLGPDREGLLEVRSPQIGTTGDWVRTSDLARIDADGFLYILGRADNAIIRGGFKIMPDKVEDALRQLPDIREACVVGIPDDRLGQVPVAAVVAAPGREIAEAAILGALRDRLKPYEIPVRIRVLEAMPRTPSLKISHAGVRDLFQPSPVA